jgi:hypothetical protein
MCAFEIPRLVRATAIPATEYSRKAATMSIGVFVVENGRRRAKLCGLRTLEIRRPQSFALRQATPRGLEADR